MTSSDSVSNWINCCEYLPVDFMNILPKIVTKTKKKNEKSTNYIYVATTDSGGGGVTIFFGYQIETTVNGSTIYFIIFFPIQQIKKRPGGRVLLFPPDSVGNHGGNPCPKIRIVKNRIPCFGCCFLCVIFKIRYVFLNRDRGYPARR